MQLTEQRGGITRANRFSQFHSGDVEWGRYVSEKDLEHTPPH
jgi:hypothetical protein